MLEKELEAERELRKSLINASIEDIKEAYKEATGQEMSDKEAQKTKTEAVIKDTLKAIFGGDTEGSGVMGQLGNKIVGFLKNSLDDGIKEALSIYSSYQGKINARLDGTQKTFKKFMDASDKMSPFYKVSDYAKSLDKLVDSGIAYNVEQRAFLMTISDKIVTTFDANNSTLRQIIRMQAQDSTAVRMGMEASLNEYLNAMYMNTEYLSSTYDSVTEALFQAESTMRSMNTSAEFEYTVQKWLGSLVSTGMSDSTASSIAAALGAIGSGDVSVLGSDVGNLITMAAARAGMSIGDILTGGLTANITDELMASMVDFMQEWGATTNNVVRSQIAGLFGVNVSDLISSLNVKVNNVVGNNITSNQALGKLTGKMTNSFSYGNIMSGNGGVTVTEALDNMLDNAMLNMGAALADNGYQYLLYKTSDLIANATGGMFSGGNIVNTVASAVKVASLIGAGAENLIDIINGTSSFGFNIVKTFERLGDMRLGGNYTGASASYSVDSSGKVTAKQTTGTTDVESIKAQAQEDSETERKLAQAPYEIQQYLLNTFDKKFDALMRLTAATADYSISDQYGVRVGNDVIDSILGQSTVKITANPADTTQLDLTQTISDNVAGIYTLLQRLVSGETSMATRQINAGAQLAYQYGEVRNAITSVIMG